MSWKYPGKREVPDIGKTVIAVESDKSVTLAKRNKGYWWTDLKRNLPMRPPTAWTEQPHDIGEGG